MRVFISVFCMVAVALIGVANAEAPKDQTTPEAFGSVEGDIVLHGQPKANVDVLLLRQLTGGGDFSRTTETDAKGHFRFDKIPDGEYSVGHQVMYTPRGVGWSSPTGTDTYRRHVIVESGEHVIVPPYPKGHTLKGRMVLAPGSTYDVAWQGEDMRHIYTTNSWSKGKRVRTPEESHAWWEKFRKTKKFKKEWTKGTRIVLMVEPDGSFHAFDVPPGNYKLNIEVGRNVELAPGVLPANVFTSFTMPDADLTLPDLQVREPATK